MTRGRSSGRVVAVGIGGIVFVVCAVYIERSFQWREILALLSGADLAWFFAAGGASIIAYWVVRAFRWYILLRSMQTRARFLHLYLCSSVALSVSIFTPFQSGELLKAELLKKHGNVGRLPGYSAFMIERVADLYVVIAIGTVALALRFGSLSTVNAALLGALFVALPIGAYIVLHRLRFRGRLGEVVDQVQGGIDSPAMLSVLLLSTLLGWVVVALGWHACLRSLSISLSCTEVLGLLSAITLASVASFIPGGLGVAEAGTAEYLLRMGVSAAGAQAGAVILRCFSLYTIGLGVAHLLVSGIKLTGPSDASGRPS